MVHELTHALQAAAAGSANPPRTTAEILRAGLGAPPLDLESPGIDTLPLFAADYAIDFYDRVGAWLTYVLLLPQSGAEHRSSAHGHAS